MGVRLPTSGLAWWLLVLTAAGATARLTMFSLQAGCALALVILIVGLYVRDRTAGLVAVWVFWLAAPFLRRVFFVYEPLDTEPLALAPFVATAAVAGLELTKVSLSARGLRLLRLVVAGYAIGVPLGVLIAPTSAAFALFAYLTAAGCFVIGYREVDEGRRLALPAALMVATPLLALYAFHQYYLPLPEWDAVWFENADIGTAGSPDGDRVRVWGTLNSPGTFALILGVAGVAFIALARLTPANLIGALAVLGALALTYVRSAWLGLVVAVLAVGLASRGAAIKRVAPLLLVMVALAPLALSDATGAALGERVTTFQNLEQDESADARINRPLGLVPFAVSQPLGRGVGRAGEASQLSDRGGFRHTDNGYLSLVFQVGPIGFLLVMAALLMALRSALRNVRRRREATDVFVLGVLAFLMTILLAGDAFYGVGGMILWYMAGLAVRRAESGPRTAT